MKEDKSNIRPCANRCPSEVLIDKEYYDHYYIRCPECWLRTKSYRKLKKALREWNDMYKTVFKK